MHLDPLTWSWEFFDEQYRLCRIVVASRRAERERAYRLARETTGAAVSYFDLQAETLNLLALDDEENAIGTLSVVLDGPDGLPGDDVFSEELGALRVSDRRVCEISRLAIAPQHENSRLLLANMFTLGAIYARRILQAAEIGLVRDAEQRSSYQMRGFKHVRNKRATNSTLTLMRASAGVQEHDTLLNDEEHTARTLDYLNQPMSESDAEYFCIERESFCATPR